MQEHEIRLNVADVVVSLRSGPGVRLVGQVDSFLAEALPEATVNIRFGCRPDWTGRRHLLFEGGDFGWNAFRTADGESILVERLAGDMLVRFSPDPGGEVVDVLLDRPAGGPAGGRQSERELLLVETMPVPVVALLSGRGGIFLHSCGVVLDGQGILLAGVSGSGKSTMAELWRRFGPPGSAVIDDEHILARNLGESTVLFGAPWSRVPRPAMFSRTPARAIFFLEHGELNRCDRLSSGEALAQLMSQVFLPIWSQMQMELAMQTCAGLLGNIDCYRLQFVPDSRVVGFIQDILGGSQ